MNGINTMIRMRHMTLLRVGRKRNVALRAKQGIVVAIHPIIRIIERVQRRPKIRLNARTLNHTVSHFAQLNVTANVELK